MTDTLEEFSTEFQAKAIGVMLQDKKFLDQAQDIIDASHFESKAHEWLVDKILWYFREYRQCPTLEVFKVELDKEKENKVLYSAVVSSLKSIISNEEPDQEYIRDQYLTFCKNQALKNAIMKSVDLLELREYDAIKAAIDKASRAGHERNYGLIWREEIPRFTRQNARDVIPVPWGVMNSVMGGGLGKGELGAILAPSGAGKCVDEDTEIEIEYDEYCIKIQGQEVWFAPWELLQLSKNIKSYELALLGGGKTT